MTLFFESEVEKQAVVNALLTILNTEPNPGRNLDTETAENIRKALLCVNAVKVEPENLRNDPSRKRTQC